MRSVVSLDFVIAKCPGPFLCGGARATALAMAACLAWSNTMAQRNTGVHEMTPVAEGVWIATPNFGGANATIILTETHVVVVDPHSDPATARALIEELATLTDKPIRFVINTHWHSDHHGGNRALEEAFPDEITFIAHPNTARDIVRSAIPESGQMGPFYSGWARRADEALQREVLANGTVVTPERAEVIRRYILDLNAFTADIGNYPYKLPDLLTPNGLTLTGGGRTISVVHPGPAHTNGDLWVHLPEQNIVIAGDILTAPYIVPRSGFPAAYANVLRELAGLDASIVLGHGGPIKLDSQLALLMAAFLDATVAVAVAAVDTDMTFAQALDVARQDPTITSFEGRIAWEEPGLRFLDFDGLLAMTLERAYDVARDRTGPLR